MGYLFLMISLLAGTTKGYCGKKTSGFVQGYRDALLMNTIRMLLCVLIGFVMIVLEYDVRELIPNGPILAVSALSGITTSVFVVCWLLSVQKGAYMMLDVFLMLGVLVPLTAGQLFFREVVSVKQWTGVLILLIAVYIMCTYNKTIKGQMSSGSLALLMICGIANGLTDFSQKLFVMMDSGVPTAVFNFYTYLFSAIVLFGCYLFSYKSERNRQGENFCMRSILGYVLIMSICLFTNSYFKTLAAGYLDSAMLYPLNQGCALILSSIMSATLFHEKLTVRCVTGLITAFVGLLVLNVL